MSLHDRQTAYLSVFARCITLLARSANHRSKSVSDPSDQNNSHDHASSSARHVDVALVAIAEQSERVDYIVHHVCVRVLLPSAAMLLVRHTILKHNVDSAHLLKQVMNRFAPAARQDSHPRRRSTSATRLRAWRCCANNRLRLR